MKEVVNYLIQLQHIDTRFKELQLQKGDLPMVIEEAENDLQEKLEAKNELAQKIEKLGLDRRMFEGEIEASKNILKKYEDQLYSVQTNKEYDAISLEIDTKKNEIGELENKILQSIDEEEEAKKEIAGLAEETEKIEKQLAEYHRELEEIIAHTREEETRLSDKRQKVESHIDPRYIRQYERIRNAKDGLAVVPITRGSCGGCFSAIPPQKIVEIHESNRLFTCEYCGRILVWDEEE